MLQICSEYLTMARARLACTLSFHYKYCIATLICSALLAWPEDNMDVIDIQHEMRLENGDEQERMVDPLRSPLPTGSNEWERGFMESMRKAKRNGWRLSAKQIGILNRIRDEEEDNEVFDCYIGEWREPTWEEDEAARLEEWEADHAHMTPEQIKDFYVCLRDYEENCESFDLGPGPYYWPGPKPKSFGG